MVKFHSLEAVGRGSWAQLQVGENENYSILRFNPLSPCDALKHHFTPLKTYLIFSQIRVLEGQFR